MTVRIIPLVLLAVVLAAGEAQQVSITPPRSESTIRSVALDKDGQPTAEGQAVLAQMSTDGWRPGSMTALSPALVAVLFTRSMPQAKPATATATATPPPAQPD